MLPKNIVNSDKKMRESILAFFAADKRTKSVDLRVGVMNGIAHLAGTVDSLMIRNSAEEIARNVKGIRGVVNRIDAPGAPNPSRVINLEIKDER